MIGNGDPIGNWVVLKVGKKGMVSYWSPPLPPSPRKGTHNVALTDHQVAEILQAEEEVIPSKEEQEETAREPVSTIPEEDFSVSNRPKLAESSATSSRPQSTVEVNNDKGTTDIPKAIVLLRKSWNNRLTVTAGTETKTQSFKTLRSLCTEAC
nr:hypothetical protein CFP56_59933 [Quercus suber]